MRSRADTARIRALLEALGNTARRDLRAYLTGGASAVLCGWRESTIDVDVLFVPDEDRLLRALPHLKESLRINIELACPADFIPELPGWEKRSRFIEQFGKLGCYHYDFYAQALAKIERGHSQDLSDVGEMLRRGLIEPKELLRCFAQIEPKLYRYPAVDPASFRRAVVSAIAPPAGT